MECDDCIKNQEKMILNRYLNTTIFDQISYATKCPKNKCKYNRITRMEKIEIKILNESTNPLPTYATTGASGMDVRAMVDNPLIVPPRRSVLVSTGLKVAIPEGYEIQVRPRSGLAFKNGITVLNTPGTVDSDYCGEIKVIIINHSDDPFIISCGDRIAQLVCVPVIKVDWNQVLGIEDLPNTTRGEGGFNSTGNK
jgi:dUTP pyrophosphatase